MENEKKYEAPRIVDLGSLEKNTEDGNVPKVGSAVDGYTGLGLGTGDLPPLP